MLEKIQSKDIFKEVKNKLLPIYPDNEASQMAFWLLNSLLSLKKQDFILDKTFTLEDTQKVQLHAALLRLQNHEPIQYVLGEVRFYGLDFQVSSAVLIPRPETEELVDWILKEHQGKKDLTILDIGTGSGCIPITLAKNLDSSYTIHAIDISLAALAIAKENAVKNEAQVHFWELDILQNEETIAHLMPFQNTSFDVIVSNPPYISTTEKAQMQKNVLDYEPPLALFVESENPLLFYEKISVLAKKYLKEGGKLYFEINESFGNEVISVLQKNNFQNIRIAKDLQGKNRMVSGEKIDSLIY